MLDSRPLDRLRAAQNILRLAEKVGPQRLEKACARAIHFNDIQYRRIKQILNAGLDHEPLPNEAPPPPPAETFAFARNPQDFFPQDEVQPC